MKTALFLLLDEYADWEASYLNSELNQSSEWQVKTVSLQDIVTSIGGFKTLIDYNLNQTCPTGDLLILIGGNNWHIESTTLLNFINENFNSSKPIGAICGAVDYLAKNGFLNQYHHTGNSIQLWAEFPNYLNHKSFKNTQSIRDNHLVTANGTAPIEFTEQVLKMINLDSDENIDKISFMNRFGFYEYCRKFGNPYE